MSTRLSRAVDRLNTRLNESVGELLTLRSVSQETVTILMKIGKRGPSQFAVLGSTPGPLDGQQANPANAVVAFSFLVSDLDFGNGIVEPEIGMQVLWPDSEGGIRVMTCLTPVNGELAWDYEDKLRTRYVIRTQQTDEEEAL